MLTNYINNLITQAKYDILEDDNSYYGEISGIQGVWANEKSLTECQRALREILEEWLLIKLRRNEKLPIIKKINLNFSLKQLKKKEPVFI